MAFAASVFKPLSPAPSSPVADSKVRVRRFGDIGPLPGD